MRLRGRINPRYTEHVTPAFAIFDSIQFVHQSFSRATAPLNHFDADIDVYVYIETAVHSIEMSFHRRGVIRRPIHAMPGRKNHGKRVHKPPLAVTRPWYPTRPLEKFLISNKRAIVNPSIRYKHDNLDRYSKSHGMAGSFIDKGEEVVSF